MVVLNRIYTRTGDDGTTALGSGERRPKYDLRIGAYGTVDETNAAIGIARLHLAEARELDAMLGLIQNDLFDLGADLAVPEREGKAERLRMLSSQVERLYPAEAYVSLNGERRKAMADQITTISKRRLQRSMGMLGKDDIDAVSRVVSLQLGI